MVASILPPNATPLELNLEQAGGASIETMPVPIRDLYNADTCPTHLLPWLAWAMDVEQWQSSWSESVQRAAIKASMGVHNAMGTVGALKQALAALGYAPVQIVEFPSIYHSGILAYNGTRTHAGQSFAYQFDVFLSGSNIFNNPMHHNGTMQHDGGSPTAQRIAKIKEAIAIYKNARSHLRNLHYTSLFFNGIKIHNGALRRDGGLILG